MAVSIKMIYKLSFYLLQDHHLSGSVTIAVFIIAAIFPTAENRFHDVAYISKATGGN